MPSPEELLTPTTKALMDLLLMWVSINVTACNDIILNNYVKTAYTNFPPMI